MDAPAHGHIQEEDPHRAGLRDGEEEHHEKKSVLILKKVKNKAKKIKDTLSKKKHGHDEEEHGHDDEEEDEEEEEEEVYVEDDVREQDAEIHGAATYESAAAPDIVPGLEEGSGTERVNLGNAGSDQTSVTDTSSTGGVEPGVLLSFQGMSVSDQPEMEREYSSPTGSHDQFSPDPPPAGAPSLSENPQLVPENPEEEREDEQQQKPPKEQSYTEKISSATSAISDKAASAKDAAVSAAVGSTEYGKKIASSVYEKAAGAGTAVMGKTQQQQQGSTGTEGGDGKVQTADKRLSMMQYLAEKLSPGEEDRALCEVISDVIQKRKEEEDDDDVRRESPEEEEGKKVTGSGERGEGKGVVGKIKGAVTSLFGGSNAPPVEAREETADPSRE